MSEKLAKYFDKKFTPVVVTVKDDSEEYMDFSDIEKPKDLTEDLTEVLTDDETEKLTTDDLIPVDENKIKKPTVEKLKPEPLDVEKLKEAKGLFRRDTKETLKALLNRIIKLESAVSAQEQEIKQLKNGIKSINQALPETTRKEAFGNYFSNSLGGALNPNKVYPKITFTEFKKLYNEL